MVNMVKYLMLRILKLFDLDALASLKSSGPLKDDGWFRSVKTGSSVDGDGNPLPWLTYPAIEFLKLRINSAMSVFEYGCGNGTLWWASRVKEVIAVEHDKNWYDKILPRAPRNVSIYHIDLVRDGAYARKICDYDNKFDIIVIDGRDRINCAKNSLKAIKPNGIIIWDNSDRSEYQDGHDFLRNNGFKKIEFVGMCPAVNLKTETAVFYRENNILDI
jgi:precorrin-6B methylase 2